MGDGPVIVWFRQDLRIADNPALSAAAKAAGADGRTVIPVFVLDDAAPDTGAKGDLCPGGASRWWLHHSLAALGEALDDLGAPLVLRRGRAAEVIQELVDAAGAAAVFWNRCYEPHAVARDRKIKSSLQDQGIGARSFNGALLFEPWEIETSSGGPYRVYTPFWKACLARPGPEAPGRAPESLKAYDGKIESEALDDWTLLPDRPNWAQGFEDRWTPGEAGARARLGDFLDEALADYADGRDRPDKDFTSRLSPHLHFGEISPRQVWHGVERARQTSGSGFPEQGARKFLSEIGWREFCHHLLFHFPTLPHGNYNDKFDDFPWRNDPGGLRAWQTGQTGFPIVDAGMRQLWATGWMHNRVRMIVASFLTKDLLVHWRHGEAWFRDTLVDADLANNAAGWQWVAGSGADAAPYFRVFNPMTQGKKFDPDGDYVREWVPEIAALPGKYLQAPWTAPDDVLAEAELELGRDYPKPIVDHKTARERALDAYGQIKGS